MEMIFANILETIMIISFGIFLADESDSFLPQPVYQG